jgi:hypothetical protein
MAKPKKLTPSLLRKLVLQEKRRIRETLESGVEDVDKVKAEEVDADEYANSLESDIDWMKALKITERRLKTKLKKVQENRLKLRKKITRKL